jgi:hypothetical protein
MGERRHLIQRIETHDVKCKAVDSRDVERVAECERTLGDLQQAYGGYSNAVDQFTQSLYRREARALSGPAAKPVPPRPRIPAVVAPPANTAMPHRAAELMAVLDRISARDIYRVPEAGGHTVRDRQPLPKGKPAGRDLIDLNCQTFFRALGDELARRGRASWDGQFNLDRADGLQADGIFRAISAEAGAGGRWREVTPERAQVAANAGQIAIGGVPANPARKREHGHLAVVTPLPPGMKLRAFRGEGSGPFVRDGNEHRPKEMTRVSPSTWGAIRASRMMPPGETRWFVFVPSTAEPE